MRNIQNSIILKYLILLLGLPQTSPKYVPNLLHFILSVKIGNKIIFYFWHHNRKGLWCHWPTVLYFYICKLFLYCMTLKSPHLIEQTRKIMVPNVAMNFLNWWTDELDEIEQTRKIIAPNVAMDLWKSCLFM